MTDWGREGFCLPSLRNGRVKIRYEKIQEKQKLFGKTEYQAGSWPKQRKVVMKAEWLEKVPNSRFVVTNLSYEPRALYEFYTERGGTCEVRIDDPKNGLKADRLSCHRFLANQFRLFLHMAAYWIVQRLREALAKTELAQMQIQQLRLRLLKIGAQVIQTVRYGSASQAVIPGETFSSQLIEDSNQAN